MPNLRMKLFKIATILLAVSFFVQMLTVIAMVFFRNLALKLKAFHALGEIHEYNGFLFATLVLVHLYFNRGWIRANILKRRKDSA